MTNHIRPKKSLGQNFLKDPHYIRRIVDAAQVSTDDQVLEIGPGLGHLTRELAARAKTVLALELDERLIPILREEFKERTNIEFVHADALEYPYDSLHGTWKVVANLPYYISTPIIQRLIAARSKFISLTLMLQKEVAERIAAPPGGKEYGYISVVVQFHTMPRIEFMVPAGAFTPMPDVDSVVVTLRAREQTAVSVRSEEFFVRVIKAAFSQRRKKLSNTIRQLGLSKERTEHCLQSAGIDPGRRAETVSVEEFGRLADLLYAELSDNIR